MAEENKGPASVSVLANTGFGFMLFLDFFIYSGTVSIFDAMGMLIFALFFLVGVSYLIAGIIEVKRGEGAVAWIILIYSMFGFATGFIYLASYIIPGITSPLSLPTLMFMYWVFWIFISIVSGVVLLKHGIMIGINLFWLAATFLLFAIAGYQIAAIEIIASIFALVQGFYNWYLVAAIVINTTYRRMLLPLK